jgi:hypothetical protein
LLPLLLLLNLGLNLIAKLLLLLGGGASNELFPFKAGREWELENVNKFCIFYFLCFFRFFYTHLYFTMALIDI